MESEKADGIKRYNNPLNFQIIKLLVQVIAVVALISYWCFPAIVNLLEEVTLWFDWFRLFLKNPFIVFVVLNALIALTYISVRKSAVKNDPDLYDQYFAAVRTPPQYNYRVTEVEDDYKEVVPSVQAVKKVEERLESNLVTEVKSKSYRRTRSEAKTEKKSRTVKYRRTESERVTKTTSCRVQTMEVLSSEEFRMTVETFITEKKKKMLVDQCQNGAVFPNNVTEWRNSVVYWKGQGNDDGTGGQRQCSRSRLLGGSGSTGSGSYLAISN